MSLHTSQPALSKLSEINDKVYPSANNAAITRKVIMKIRNYAPYDTPSSYEMLEAFINKSRGSRRHNALKLERDLRRFAYLPN